MKIGQRIMRFGIKKLSIGVVSVAVGFAFLAPAGISANELKQDVTSEVATRVLDSKEELREPENAAPKLETPLREEPRLAPQTLPEASEVLENKREESKVEITEPAQDSPVHAPVEETKEEVVTEKPTNTRSLTAEDLVKISKGELHLENDLIDESLYGEKGKEVARQYVSKLDGTSLDVQLNGKLGRRVRVQLRKNNQAFSLAEVEVFRFIATNGETATQVSKPVQPISQAPVKDKTLTIQHSGAYIARYSITWEEVTVDKDGNQVVRSRSWEGNGRNQTAGFVLNLPIKGNMRNLRIKIEKKTGLLWNRWQTIYDNRPLLAQPHRKITHWGTTLNSKVSDDDVL